MTEQPTNDDEPQGSWDPLPDPATAATHATPFPDFEDGWEIQACVHDLNIAHMTRITQEERNR